MRKLEDVDKNLKIETKLEEKDVVFYDVKDAPFDLYGFYSAEKGDKFLRLSHELGKSVNDGIATLYTHTAGGRVRFKTNSPYVAISVKYPSICRFPHMPLTGTTGFDMYSYNNGVYRYEKTFIPPYDVEDGFESVHHFFEDNREVKDITINFPLYNEVTDLYIGIAEGSEITEGGKYTAEKPIVYYGSSITQGGCASRPGNSYQAMVTRELNLDHINLGFSGNARAEDNIVEYIANMDMSCFVMDYDHNAPNAEHLKNTHKKMFDTIRAKNPALPIVLMTSPFCGSWVPPSKEAGIRKQIILDTYNAAKAKGDENVYFIDCGSLFGAEDNLECGSVDGTHPTDLGFMHMAKAVLKVLDEIFK